MIATASVMSVLRDAALEYIESVHAMDDMDSLRPEHGRNAAADAAWDLEYARREQRYTRAAARFRAGLEASDIGIDRPLLVGGWLLVWSDHGNEWEILEADMGIDLDVAAGD